MRKSFNSAEGRSEAVGAATELLSLMPPHILPHMRRVLLGHVALMCAFHTPYALVSQTAQATMGFDNPVSKQKIDLGLSQSLAAWNAEHVTLNCYYYPTFMVKELDDPGVKGADPLVMPFSPGQKPTCSAKPQRGELHLNHWSGYFMGVNNNLVFIEAADGLNGAMEFEVFDPQTGTQIFHDERYVAETEDLRKLSFVRTHTSQTTLRYLRAYFGTCSIPKHGIACWRKFQQQTGLVSTSMPNCRSDDYEGHDQGDDPSVIFYPVEITFSPKPHVKVTGPVARCSPTE